MRLSVSSLASHSVISTGWLCVCVSDCVYCIIHESMNIYFNAVAWKMFGLVYLANVLWHVMWLRIYRLLESGEYVKAFFMAYHVKWVCSQGEAMTKLNGKYERRRWKIQTIIIKLDCTTTNNDENESLRCTRKVSAIICNRIICIRHTMKIAHVYNLCTRFISIASSLTLSSSFLCLNRFVFMKASLLYIRK